MSNSTDHVVYFFTKSVIFLPIFLYRLSSGNTQPIKRMRTVAVAVIYKPRTEIHARRKNIFSRINVSKREVIFSFGGVLLLISKGGYTMDNLDMKYLTVDEVKTITRMSNDSIRRHIRNGNIKATKIGVRYLVKPSDLQAFMDMNASENKVQSK